MLFEPWTVSCCVNFRLGFALLCSLQHANNMEIHDWTVQVWGLLNQFSPFRYFPNFSEWWKQWLPEWYQVHICQVSPQLSCGDTWQIWTWLKVFNLYFCKIKISRNGEINERSFSNPHPWSPLKPCRYSSNTGKRNIIDFSFPMGTSTYSANLCII